MDDNRQEMSGFQVFRGKDSDHRCVPKINTERIFKSSRSYFIIVTMGLKKTRWICESLGNLKVVGQQAKSKINELSIHTIAGRQLHVFRHSIPKVHILGFDQIYYISLSSSTGETPSIFQVPQESENTYISRYGERWVDKLKSSTSI